MKKLIAITAAVLLAACAEAQTETSTPQTETVKASVSNPENLDTAVFAGGCFWCTESDFEKLPGVIEAVSGYSGGHTVNPTYKEVTYKETGHYEVVKVTFDKSVVSYDDLLAHFWVNIDPTDPRGQFCDKGSSYRSAIFARPDQIEAARTSKQSVIETKPFRADIVTPVLEASVFYVAEDYHQDFYKKEPAHYNRYRQGCGRDKRLQKLWGK